jgi:hypothetical protein
MKKKFNFFLNKKISTFRNSIKVIENNLIPLKKPIFSDRLFEIIRRNPTNLILEVIHMASTTSTLNKHLTK